MKSESEKKDADVVEEKLSKIRSDL